MEKNFEELGLSEDILKSIKEIGFDYPTQVQEKAIKLILNNSDLVVKSKTGSGKTAAFGLPILEKIDNTLDVTQVLILTPTRELAVQVNNDLVTYSKYKKVSLIPVYGQHSINTEISQLEKGPQIVTGTPGRVYDHILKKTLKTQNIKYLVLDEADVMLNMGFIDQVVNIIKKIPRDRITLLFSASMPDEIKKISKQYMNNPEIVEVKSETETVDSITQYYYRVEHNEKRKQLDRVLITENPESCIIFCNTRIEVDRVCEFLRKKGFSAKALHGAISQSRRLHTINQFKSGEFTFLIATDVASRGIHVNDVSHVINYDVPIENDSYIHRIGRTGRAGNGGKAITFTTGDDIYSIYEIEEHIGAMINERELPTDEEVKEKKQYVKYIKYEEHTRKPTHSAKPHNSRPKHIQKVNNTHPVSKKLHVTSEKSKNESPTYKKHIAKSVNATMSKTEDKSIENKPTQNPISRPITKTINTPISKPIQKQYTKAPNEQSKKTHMTVSSEDSIVRINAKDYKRKKRIEKIKSKIKSIFKK